MAKRRFMGAVLVPPPPVAERVTMRYPATLAPDRADSSYSAADKAAFERAFSSKKFSSKKGAK